MANNVMTLSPEQRRLPAPLRTSLAEIRERTKPIDPKALAVMLNETLALWPQPAEFKLTAKFYREALEDVPAELVAKALRIIRLTSKFFPKPAEIREAIKDDLNALRRRKWDLEREARNYRPPAPEIPPEERQKVARQLAQLARTLKRVEADPSDLTP